MFPSFCPISLLWIEFSFPAFFFIFFCIASTGKGVDMRLLRLVRKSRSWHPSRYVATEAEYLNIATFHTIALSMCSLPFFSTFDISLFSIFLAIKGVFVSHAPIFILFFLGRLNNPNQKPLLFFCVISSSGDKNKYWVAENLYIAVLGSWSENNSFQAFLYQE